MQKKSLLTKILLFIGVPVAITYCIAAVITLNTVNQSVSHLTTNELTAKSQSASYQIEGTFIKYMEMAKQMASDSQFEQLCYATTPNTFITNAPGFPEALKTMVNIEKSDPEHIMCSWVVDFETNNITDSDGWVGEADYDATIRPWYQDLMKKKDVIMTDPYVDTNTELTIVSSIAPVFKYGTQEIIGAVGIDFNIDSINVMLKKYKLGETGYYILASKDGQIIYHPNKQYKNVNLNDTKMSDNIKKAMTDKKVGNIEFSNGDQKSLGYVSTIGDTGWVVATGLPEKEFDSVYSAVQLTTLIIFGLALIIIITLIVLISRRIVNPLKRLALAADKLALGDVEVDVADIPATEDEVGELTVAFSKMTENIKQQAKLAEKIAAGDLNVEVLPQSEKDVLGMSMISVIDTLKNLVKEAEDMTRAAIEGRLEERGNADKFNGGYKEIIKGFNSTLDALIAPMKMSVDYLEMLCEGNLPEKITEEMKGDYNRIKDSTNACIDAIHSLIEDAKKLAEAALEGKLNVRADVSKHGGDFAKIIEGLNHTLDAVVGPLKISADYIAKIGRGEIPEEITDTYQGEFNEIKNNINACIAGLGALVEGNEILYKMGKQNDYSDKVEGSYQGIYQEIAQSINNVISTMGVIIRVISNVSRGDVSDLDDMKKIGCLSEQDMVLPPLIQMVENIQMLTEETQMLSAAAIEGNLGTRGDSDKFEGEFANIIKGINDTLESVIAPIEEASAVLKEMSAGNLHVTMDGDYKGEHAVIKHALNETLENLLSYVIEISSILTEIANGNLNLAITADYKGDFVEIKDSLNNIIVTLSQVMGDIRSAADQVAAGSRQVSDGSQTLSQGSTEQASSIQQLTASISEIASQTRENAVNANQASEFAGKAKDSAINGNDQMQEMLSSMVEINESSTNISKIIKVIDDIAFQTNILALNAAVEAARAGQHGKGFAVVAEEVRNLAARSAEAAKGTTELIEGSINKVQAGTKIANETAAALNEIVGEIEKAAVLVVKIAQASNEQASGINQINKGVEQVSQVVQNNSATAEESAAASEELSSQAEILKEMVNRFKMNKETKTLAGSTIDQKTLNDVFEEPRIFLDIESDKY